MEERQFSEEEIEKYLKYTEDNVIELEEVLGHCFICGKLLDEVESPVGPEKKVVCLKDRDFFVEQFAELIEMKELKNTSWVTNNTNVVDVDKDKKLSFIFDELYIGEIILLEWLHNKSIDKSPPKYFCRWYSININSSIPKLESKGYIRRSTKKEVLESLTVSDLKNILKNFHINVSGKRNDLINRIIVEISEDQYGFYVQDSWYVTAKGRDFICKYEIFIWAHKKMSTAGFSHGITPQTVAKFTSLNISNEEIGILITNDVIQESIKYEVYCEVVSNSIIQASLYIELGDRQKALDSLLVGLLFCLTGVTRIFRQGHIFYNGFGYYERLKNDIIAIQFDASIVNEDIIYRAVSTYKSYSNILTKYSLCPDIENYNHVVDIMLTGTERDWDVLIEQWKTGSKISLD